MPQRYVDLGELSGPVLLFGGPYSNLQAAEALFAQVGHIPKANRICTGDVVAYCANPAQTAALVRHETGAIVAGNCELQLASGEEDCGCGFDEGTACDLASKSWFPFASEQMRGDVAQFADLPDIAVFTHAGRRFAVIHGGMSDVSRFIWPTDDGAVFNHEISLLEREVGLVDGVVCGHSGIPFERQIGARVWINAGVIGMPPHDGRPLTRYAVLDAGRVTFHELRYDHQAAAQAMRKAGLTQGYEVSLESGIWPSEDILPVALRRPRDVA
jgi:predicted phosphodiesterase